MSRKYEGLIVLNTKGKEGNVDELVSLVAKEMESEGATLEEIEQLGRKTFANESRHIDGGHYINVTFNAETDAIPKIKTRLKLNTTVHTQNYLRKA